MLVDPALGAAYYDGAGGGAIERWAAGDPGAFDLAEDVAWLEARLGPWPAEHPDWTIAFVVPPARKDAVVGAADPGWVAVAAFAPTVGDDDEWRPTVLHELAHAWVHVAVTADDGAEWLIEALPALLETMRYPEVGENGSRFNVAVN